MPPLSGYIIKFNNEKADVPCLTHTPQWSLTTPLLLLDLSFLAGLNGASMLIAIFADVTMCLTGLFAAFGSGDGQKWGYYTVACIAYLVIVYQLGFNGRTAVANKDQKTKVFFSLIAGYTLVLWTAYPMYVTITIHPPLLINDTTSHVLPGGGFRGWNNSNTNSLAVSGASATARVSPMSTPRSSPTASSTSSPSPSSASGC